MLPAFYNLTHLYLTHPSHPQPSPQRILPAHTRGGCVCGRSGVFCRFWQRLTGRPVKTHRSARKDSQVGLQRLTGRPTKTQSSARKDSKFGLKGWPQRFKGRPAKTQRSARKDSKVGPQRLKGRPAKTHREASKDSKL